MKAADFVGMSRRQLIEALCAGHAIDPAALDDTEYKGVSLGLPGFIDRLSWKTFKKTFHRDPESGHLRGWNVRLEQHGIDAPCVPMKTKHGEPLTFGHYRVVDPAGYRMPKPANRGLLIDYGLGGNAALSFTNRLRDPIVAVNEGDATLLLGWSYADLGILRFGTPSFFTLELDGPLSHDAAPPRKHETGKR